MCWSSRYCPIKRGAQNPIIVYKVVTYINSSECRSLYTWFKYIYKRVYRYPGPLIGRILKTNVKLPSTWNIIKLFIIILLSCFILFKVFIS